MFTRGDESININADDGSESESLLSKNLDVTESSIIERCHKD